MKKVAVFGNSAGGKVAHEGYLEAHAEPLARDQWIIDDFGCVTSAWERFAAADTLIYIDRPLLNHYRCAYSDRS
jgi:hypothetical protein